jgi:HEAT repeat protein
MFRFTFASVCLVWTAALAHGGPPPVVTEPADLPTRLTRASVEARREAAFAICCLKPSETAPLKELLINTLRQDSDARVRQLAAFALGNLGKNGQEAVKPLIEALQDKDAGVRSLAAQALGSSLVPLAKSAIPALIWQLDDKDESPCCNAARALGSFGADGKAAVARLVGLLGDARASVRREAATALGEIGFEARQSLAALKPLLGDTDPLVRDRASRAIKQIQDETVRK